MISDAEFTQMLGDHLNGYPDAVRFFRTWTDYCHEVDDAVDEYYMAGKPLPPEVLLKLLACAAMIYSSNFYQRYATQLCPMVLSITNSYADSVAWENSPDVARQRMADHLRESGNDMLILIVGLVAGWDAMRKVSPVLREHTYYKQHDESHKPI